MDLAAEWTMTIFAEVGEPALLGQTARGVMTVIPIEGGTVEGPGWAGQVVPGGADWNTVGKGLTGFYARYSFKTSEGLLVTLTNEGITDSDFSCSLVKTRATFEVDRESTLAHLLYGIHVGTVDVDRIGEGVVKITVYRLL